MLKSTAQAVRGAVKLNDVRITGWSGFEVENNSFSSSDTFSCQFAANALPADRNAAWFSTQQDMYVELFAGVPSNPNKYTPEDLTSWIYGQVDKISFDPVAGIVEISGRDLTRLMIDAKTTEKWQNKTSSQIASIIAARHGMIAQVTATTTPVGKYYEIDHEHMHDARTEWDLLTQLARQEQFIVYVRGKTLYFRPRPTLGAPDTSALQDQLNKVTAAMQPQLDQANALIAQGQAYVKQGDQAAAGGDNAGAHALYLQAKTVNDQAGVIIANLKSGLGVQQKALKAQIAGAQASGAYPIIWTPPDPRTGFPTCNVTGLKLDRALTVSRGIIVTVRSFNDAAQKTFTATYPTNAVQKTKPGSSNQFGGAQTYFYNVANLDQQKTVQYAQAKYDEIIRHEMLMSFEIPAAGNDALDINTIIQLKGTGTAWDQVYYPDSLKRRLNIEEGYQLSVSAKNHAPDSQVMTS